MIKYKNSKPVVVVKPPWWRSHIFPWGWYWLPEMKLSAGDVIASSYANPGDSVATYKIHEPAIREHPED